MRASPDLAVLAVGCAHIGVPLAKDFAVQKHLLCKLLGTDVIRLLRHTVLPLHLRLGRQVFSSSRLVVDLRLEMEVLSTRLDWIVLINTSLDGTVP